MKKILIVDSTPYINELSELLNKNSYTTVLTDTALDAIAMLKSENFDLIISEVTLPGDNSFELYFYLNKNYPYLPVIMITDKELDGFFEEIFEKGIGNVINKPVNESELINLADKLTDKSNIFGLDKYLTGIIEIKKMRITSSSQIQKSINIILDYMKKRNFMIDNIMMLNLILNELIINAVYHSFGFTREKEERKAIILPDGKFVEIDFAFSESSLGISITDFNGTLTKNKILESMYKVVFQKKIIDKAVASGQDISSVISETGRGIELVRQLVSEYYFVINRQIRTDIILIFNSQHEFDTKKLTSLKIIEFD